METWIIRNPLSDKSETFDVRICSQGAVVDINACDEAHALRIKEAIDAGAIGISIDLRNAS